jgi:hypothetical protein
MVREVSIEKFLADQIRLRGGVCIKLNPAWNIGIPDRLCIFVTRDGPSVIAFVELKRPKGGRATVVQKWWKKRLTDLGCECHILSTKDEVTEFLCR